MNTIDNSTLIRKASGDNKNCPNCPEFFIPKISKWHTFKIGSQQISSLNPTLHYIFKPSFIFCLYLVTIVYCECLFLSFGEVIWKAQSPLRTAHDYVAGCIIGKTIRLKSQPPQRTFSEIHSLLLPDLLLHLYLSFNCCLICFCICGCLLNAAWFAFVFVFVF